MVDSIRAMKKEIKTAERRSARERQAKFIQKKQAEGMKRVTVWATQEDAELIRLVMATSPKSRHNLREYLLRFNRQQQ